MCAKMSANPTNTMPLVVGNPRLVSHYKILYNTISIDKQRENQRDISILCLHSNYCKFIERLKKKSLYYNVSIKILNREISSVNV